VLFRHRIANHIHALLLRIEQCVKCGAIGAIITNRYRDQRGSR
jgi:hypothetical protein